MKCRSPFLPCSAAMLLLLAPAFKAFSQSPSPARDTAPTVADPSSIRRDFLALISRAKAPLNPEIHQTASSPSLLEFHFTFTSEPGQVVPGILFIPVSVAAGRRPVIISLHGTGGRKEDEASFLRDCAARGFIGVAIDGRYHGERAAAAPQLENLNAYQSAILRTWRSALAAKSDAALQHSPAPEHPLFYDTVWDVMRLLDYLDTRDDVDPDRIGLLGISKGGIETYLTAAVDPRIAAAVPCISVESFQWALEHEAWQPRVDTFQGAFDIAAKEAARSNKDAAFVKTFYERVMPGVTGEFDGPAITPLIAPRPLMLINGANDPRTPPESLKLCTDALQAAYHAQHADDHLQILIQPNTAHQVRPASRTAAIDFFAKWLKP